MQLADAKSHVDEEVFKLLRTVAAYFRDEGVALKKSSTEYHYNNIAVLQYTLLKPRLLRKDDVYFRLNIPLERSKEGWEVHNHSAWICGLKPEVFADERTYHELQRKLDHWKAHSALHPHELLLSSLLQGTARFSVH